MRMKGETGRANTSDQSASVVGQPDYESSAKRARVYDTHAYARANYPPRVLGAPDSAFRSREGGRIIVASKIAMKR